MTRADQIVYVVDDDEAMCESLEWLLKSQGLRIQTYTSAEAFLADGQPRNPGCLVLDVRMRGMSGLDLQARLARDGVDMPVIIITGHGDIPMAVRAVRAGVMDFLEKPVNDQLLLQRIRHALELEHQLRKRNESRRRSVRRLASLTPRERQVMDLVVAGYANKQIAARLCIAAKTVEVHRRRVMRKLGVRSVVALVQMVMLARNTSPAPGA
jgi:two-component system response regulator FixJ